MANEINIRFFGMIAERIGKDTDLLTVDLEPNSNCREVISSIYPEIAEMNFQTAIDQEISEVIINTNIKEIAVLPPFAGG